MEKQSKETTAFGIAVRQLRKERGFSQDEFASIADLHRTYIGGIERGERNPTLSTIGRIAEALSVSSSELLKLAEELQG